MNPAVPEVLQEVLLTRGPDFARTGLLSNPASTSATLTRLHLEAKYDVGHYLAAHPNTPVDVLATLATRGTQNVRDSVAAAITPPTVRCAGVASGK